jgi:8-oxo-dGTP diphosphatase
MASTVYEDDLTMAFLDQRQFHPGHILVIPRSTPGGHLGFGESPEVCAARETFEETGVSVSNVEFVAITNDLLADVGKHYLTVWMRGEPDSAGVKIGDTAEINQFGWFAPDRLPMPLHLYFQNLLAGNCWPRSPANLPFTIQRQT